MDSSRIDPQLILFRRQYLQLLDPDFLRWPPKVLLQDAGAQRWLYYNLFDQMSNQYLPSDRYRFRVLKSLISKIEQAIEDPDEHEVCEEIMSQFSLLVSSGIPSEIAATQQRSYVTFTIPNGTQVNGDQRDAALTVLERRNLISGSRTTGFRTWEAGLHLASFLSSPTGRQLIADKHIIELGTGTGLVSMLCAKYFGAAHVHATDGDEAVLDALAENAFLNDLDDESKLSTSVLKWGHSLGPAWPSEKLQDQTFDLVVGSDIIYDSEAVSPLVATIRMLFTQYPGIEVLIAGAIRNADTFDKFAKACAHHAFTISSFDFPAKPMHQQTGPFYATAMPLKIFLIRSPLREGVKLTAR